jgi:hypothetical protein
MVTTVPTAHHNEILYYHIPVQEGAGVSTSPPPRVILLLPVLPEELKLQQGRVSALFRLSHL